MTYATQGRRSATLPHGITFQAKVPNLNALLVVCHGWRRPAREPVAPKASAPQGWIGPLLRWARPAWRAAA